jgi:hypothetical protein
VNFNFQFRIQQHACHPGGSELISYKIKRLKSANEKNEGQNVKAVTFKLHEPLHNLDGAKCGVQIATPVGKIV